MGADERDVSRLDRSQNRAPIQTLNEAKDSVTSIIISGPVVITASIDGHVREYDLRMGELRSDLIGRASLVPQQLFLDHPLDSLRYNLSLQSLSLPSRSPQPRPQRSSSARLTRPSGCSTARPARSSRPSAGTRSTATAPRRASCTARAALSAGMKPDPSGVGVCST